MSAELPNTVTVAEYLFTRLRQLGVEHVFGVPGDFNLALLECLEETDTPRWVGTANELGAAYAADGYARERGFGALVTTYGVGELSAINGVAGSFAERVPVLHIAGAPTCAAAAAGLPLHHTLVDGDFRHFLRAFSEVTTAQSALDGAGDPGQEIDRVIQAMLNRSLPGYLSLPEDLVAAHIPAHALASPLRPHASSPAAVTDVVHRAATLLADARDVVVLVGAGVPRARASAALRDLAETGAFAVATLLDAKGVLDEDHLLSVGTYQGALGSERTRAIVENAELLITVGATLTDTLTGAFSARLSQIPTIDVAFDQVTFGATVVEDVRLADALGAIREAIELTPDHGADARASRRHFGDPTATPAGIRDFDAPDAQEPLTQSVLWRSVADSLPPGHTVVADAGTSYYGMAAEQLPGDTRFVGQPIWSSIGYSLPATLGTQLAAPERRTVLLIGDGAAQMTIQELGTIARERLHPIVVLVNNDGYTIERAIRGPRSSYNDIAQWDWALMIRALAGWNDDLTVRSAATAGELIDALAVAHAERDRLVVIEVHTDRLDLPPALAAMTSAMARRV